MFRVTRLPLRLGLGLLLISSPLWSGCPDNQPMQTTRPNASGATAASGAPDAMAPDAMAPDAMAPDQTGKRVEIDTSKTSSAVASAAPEPEARPSGAPASMPDAPGGILTPEEADKILKLGSPPKLAILSNGAEPRERLAYEFEEGTSHQSGMGMKLGLQMNADGRTLPATEVPRLELVVDVKVGKKNDGGDQDMSAKIVAVHLKPANAQEQKIADAMKERTAALSGTEMTYAITPLGTVKDIKLKGVAREGAGDAFAQLTQSMESMVAQMPAEPVGLGAKWEVVTRTNSSGAQLLQWATYTLNKRNGPAFELGVEVNQLAASKDVAAPGMPAGMTASLRSFSSSGQGVSSHVLSSPSPTKGSLTMNSLMEIALSGQATAGATPTMKVNSSVVVDYFNPKAAPAAAPPGDDKSAP